MRIMQVISGVHTNGAVLQCLALTRALADRGHAVSVLCRPHSWIGDQLAGSRVTVIHSSLSHWRYRDCQRIAERARDGAVELLHSHQSRAHVCGLKLRWMTGIPCVATAHARHFQPHWCLNNFVIANSRATLEFHHQWNLVPRSRIRVVDYLIDLDQMATVPAASRQAMRRAWGCSDRQPVVGVIGDVIRRKGQLWLIRAWPSVLASIADARLVVIGMEKDPQYSARLRGEIDRLGLGESVHFAGYHSNIAPAMNAIDLCVSAAVEEALGLTIPEAMAASKAVVATDVGGIPENVQHGITGLLVPPAHPEAMANAIVRLLGNDEERAMFGRQGFQQVRDKYDPARQIRQIEAIYEMVIAYRHRPKVLSAC